MISQRWLRLFAWLLAAHLAACGGGGSTAPDLTQTDPLPVDSPLLADLPAIQRSESPEPTGTAIGIVPALAPGLRFVRDPVSDSPAKIEIQYLRTYCPIDQVPTIVAELTANNLPPDATVDPTTGTITLGPQATGRNGVIEARSQGVLTFEASLEAGLALPPDYACWSQARVRTGGQLAVQVYSRYTPFGSFAVPYVGGTSNWRTRRDEWIDLRTGDSGAVVTVPQSPYVVAGRIDGLNVGQMVVLQNNGADDLLVSADGKLFFFPNHIQVGAAYSVTIRSQSAELTCNVTNGAGVANSRIFVSITCDYSPVAFVVIGLTSTGLILRNNGGDDLAIPPSATGVQTFANKIRHGSSYSVTVFSQPAGQSCSIGDPSGISGSGNFVHIVCTSG